jgi:LmbE family N-acetylglucosaminyl deacetylase
MGYHPDHQLTGKLTLDALHFDSNLGLLWPSAGPAWSVREFYMWGFTEYAYYLPMTEESLQMKVKAFLEHKTQFENPQIIQEWLVWMVSKD